MLIYAPLPILLRPLATGPFFHGVGVIVRNCEPLSAPQSGPLINHWVLNEAVSPQDAAHHITGFCFACSLDQHHITQEDSGQLSGAAVTRAVTQWFC